MDSRYCAILSAISEGRDGLLVVSLSCDHGALRVEQCETHFGSIANVKAALRQPGVRFLESNSVFDVVWFTDASSFYLWSGVGRHQRVGRNRTGDIKHYFQPRLRIESNRIELITKSGRTTTTTQADAAATVSWCRCGLIVGGVSLVLREGRRIKVCSALNWNAIDRAIDVAPDLWSEETEGLQWAAEVACSLARFLNVQWIDAIPPAEKLKGERGAEKTEKGT
jgi:hypothetical protein